MSWELRIKCLKKDWMPIQETREQIDCAKKKYAFHKKQVRKLGQEIPKLVKEEEKRLAEFAKCMEEL